MVNKTLKNTHWDKWPRWWRSSSGLEGVQVKRKLSDAVAVAVAVVDHEHLDVDVKGDNGVLNNDRLANEHINSWLKPKHSWLDELTSPASIQIASLVASILIAIGMCYFPTRLERSDAYNLDYGVAGLIFQNSKVVYGANMAVVFSVVYPFFDMILDTYRLSKTSAPADVFELKNNGYMLTEKNFLTMRWVIIMYPIIVSSIILAFMDPSRDPSTLMRLLLGNIDIFPFLANGCLLSILREGHKACTTNITILIWISRLALAIVYIWSNSTALRGSMMVINMLTMSYPVLVTYMEHCNKNKCNTTSPSESDEISYTTFELQYIAVYSFLVLFFVFKDFVGIVTCTISEDNGYQVITFVIFGFVTAFGIPIFVLLLCSPERMYRQWQEEKINVLYKHSVQLLEDLLPRKVIAHFRKSKEPFVESFDCVTILFVDIMDYTVVCRLLTPYQIVLLLGDIFWQYDQAAIARGVYRVETVGDCYMACTGCPDTDDPSVAAEKMVLFAQDVIEIVRNIQPPVDLGFPLQIRIGVHSGPVTAGTLNGKMPRYCLFGDTVNTAARMESSGEVGRIHLSEDTVSLVRKGGKCSYDFQSRLPMHIKGKGVMSTYFLDVLNRDSRPRRLTMSLRGDSDPPEPHLLLKNFSLPYSFMEKTRTKSDDDLLAHDNNYNDAQFMTSESITSEESMVLRVNEDPELHMVASPQESAPTTPKNAPMSMPFLVASSLLSWDFDVQNIISKDMLIEIVFMLFKTSCLCGSLGVSEITLRNFIENVAESYHRRSFHNLQHAVSVLHITSLLIGYCNQKHIMRHGTLSLVSIFALMVGALVHDCDHPGHTNSFEVNTNSSLAQQYGNIAVLENHHLAVAESVLSTPGCNILETFDEETATMFKNLLKYIVLGTDMGVHKEIVSEIDAFETELDTMSPEIMFTLSRALLHAADLSNPVRTFDVSKAWAIRLADEHTKQVQAEEALGLTSASFMVHKDTLSVYQGEIQFLTHVAQPLWAAMAKTWPLLSGLHEQLQLNIQKYQDLVIKASEDESRILTHRV